MGKQRPTPTHKIDPRAVGHAQPRPGRDGIERDLKLPHERDESPRPHTDQDKAPPDLIKQAARDIERGLVDTERRGTPSDLPPPRRRARRPQAE
jgi:hypothetical protein